MSGAGSPLSSIAVGRCTAHGDGVLVVYSGDTCPFCSSLIIIREAFDLLSGRSVAVEKALKSEREEGEGDI